jgi:hypothetical protein
MAGLCSNVHMVGLLLNDRHRHRASHTNYGDLVVKITQLTCPFRDGSQ